MLMRSLSPHLPIKDPTLLLITFASLIFSFMPGCDGVIESKQYKGTAYTTITYLDYDTNGKKVFIEEKEYQKGVHVFIGPPKNVGSVFESNSFSLTITTEPTTGEDGEIWITSAIVLTDQVLGEILLQYWTLQLEGTTLSGILTDTHIAEASAMNQLWAWEEISPSLKMVLPFYIDVGSLLQGTVDDYEVRIHLEGTTTDRTRPFISEIVATRAP